ncbi:hypothetical protein G7Y79_00003g011510 [Physcia stellaris]|nr:hypothetical protein G7Y79_00003g011510 [Physcia stellaris]
MAANQQTANIWAQMSYTPPRGPCSSKTSIVSTCSCYRFMIHPLKAATSFECDGCGHHASFHKMDNAQDEETVRKWKGIETERDQGHERIAGLMDIYAEVQEIAPPKRRRIENGHPLGRADQDSIAVPVPRVKASNRKRAIDG